MGPTQLFPYFISFKLSVHDGHQIKGGGVRKLSMDFATRYFLLLPPRSTLSLRSDFLLTNRNRIGSMPPYLGTLNPAFCHCSLTNGGPGAYSAISSPVRLVRSFNERPCLLPMQLDKWPRR